MLKNAIASALCCASTTFLAGAEPAPDFHWSAEQTADIATPAGQNLAPQAVQGLHYAEGIDGKAFALGKVKELRYDARGLFNTSGTISFWLSPDFDGLKDSQGVHPLLYFGMEDGKSQPFVWLHVHQGLAFYVPTSHGKMESRVNCFKSLKAGDWLQVALTWNDNNWCTLYCNGRPVAVKRFSDTDFSKVKSLFIGSAPGEGRAFQGRLDEIKLYRSALGEDALFAEYKRHAVFDMVCDRDVFQANKPVSPEIAIAPLGTLQGSTYRKEEPEACEGTVSLKLFDPQGKEVATKTWSGLKVSDWTRLRLPPASLAPGLYRLVASAENGSRKMRTTFSLNATDAEPEFGPAGDLKTGEPILRKSAADFSSSTEQKVEGRLDGRPYCEAGAKKGDRIFCEFELPESYTSGQRLAIDFDWPDDKARAIGLYLYPPKGSASQIRDRLGGGIAAGEEFENSGKMQSCRYLFNGAFKKYLLEVRTMIQGKPAALAGFTIRPVEGPLPKLAVNAPAGLPGREIGHLDEDESFDYNFDWDNTRPKLKDGLLVDPKLLRQVREYCAYTGMNYFTLPLLRYNFVNYQNEPVAISRGVVPFAGTGYWAEQLGRDGIDFVAIFNISNPPELDDPRRKREFIKAGMITASSNDTATGLYINNPVHPENRRLLLKEIHGFLARFGDLENLKGIDLWMEWPSIGFHQLNYGYDDFTVAEFSKETGVNVPDFKENPQRRRYEFLTDGAVREKWLAWRAGKATALIKAIRAEIDATRPGLPLFVSCCVPYRDKDAPLGDAGLARWWYENKCLDVKAVNAIPNTTMIPMRNSLASLWSKHWNGENSCSDEILANASLFRDFKGARSFINSYRTYFETFRTSPLQDKYPSSFQNVELKGHGRFFLKELAQSVAFTDPQRIAIGAQPLAALGREVEMREFVQAYRALPALPFTDIPGASDPVTARYLQTGKDTYLYAVNLVQGAVTLKLALPAASLLDLSTGKDVQVADGLALVALKPFELRSFRIAGKVVPKFEGVEADGGFVQDLKSKVAHIEEILAKMGSSASQAAKESLALCRTHLERGEYAETQRLLFSKTLLQTKRDFSAFSNGYLQKQAAMMAQAHYAVRCGSSDYCQVNGTLFFPDRQWHAGEAYGYAGETVSITRNTDQLPQGSAMKELFQNELYNVSSYNFRVAPGKYEATLYFRIGFEKARKPGAFVVDISVNGRIVRKDFDLFQEENPKEGFALAKLEGLSPVDGMLSIGLAPVGGRDASVCLLNGVEVKRMEK